MYDNFYPDIQMNPVTKTWVHDYQKYWKETQQTEVGYMCKHTYDNFLNLVISKVQSFVDFKGLSALYSRFSSYRPEKHDLY